MGAGKWLLGFVLAAACATAGQPKVGDVVSLPKAKTDGKLSLERVLATRRSCRKCGAQPLAMEALGQLAWSAQGITKPDKGFRTAPSAANIFFLELYVVTPKVVYHYLPRKHAFKVVAVGTPGKDIAAAAKKMKFVADAYATFVFTANFARAPGKLARLAERFGTIEVGAACQNLHLQTAALGLCGCWVGLYNEDRVRQIVTAPADQRPIILFTVGAKKK